jgi:hypothetical protein
MQLNKNFQDFTTCITKFFCLYSSMIIKEIKRNIREIKIELRILFEININTEIR